MNIVVIILTYNEKDNIGHLLDELHKEFNKIDHSMYILVVDDNSPDGTSVVVRDAKLIYPNIHLIIGQKKGLGTAYIRGMKYAMEYLHADAVMEMDADFSHKPADVPRMILAMDEGTDFVIGSRYIRGGTIPDNWGLKRKVISRWGNIFPRYLASLYKVRDCTVGFRAIRTRLLKKIDLSSFRVQGYAFQIALLSKAMKNKAIIKEIPVEFVDRIRGKTKLGLSDIIEFILNAVWIRFDNNGTFIKFAAIGASCVLVSLGLFALLLYLGLNKFIASPIAIAISIISTFLFNNFWTFGYRKTK